MSRLLCLLGLLLSMPAWGAVSLIGTPNSDNTGSSTASTLSVGYDHSGGGSQAVMFASATASCVTSCPTSMTATWNSGAQSLTEISRVEFGNHVLHTFRLINPNAVNSSVVFTPSNSQRMAGGVLVLSGVDQTTPVGTPVTNSASNTTLTCASVTVPTDGMAFSGFGKSDSTEALVITAGSEQWTNVTTNATANTNRHNAGLTRTTTGDFTGTSTSSRNLTCAAVPVNAFVAPTGGLSPGFFLLRR